MEVWVVNKSNKERLAIVETKIRELKEYSKEKFENLEENDKKMSEKIDTLIEHNSARCGRETFIGKWSPFIITTAVGMTIGFLLSLLRYILPLS